LGGYGVRKTAVGALRLCAVLSHPHFFVPVKILRIFPHRAGKTSPTLNVKQHFFANFIVAGAIHGT